ncbi:hypothetical protein ACTHSJ_06095 [Paenibacillus cellulositrophicus]
MNLKAAEYMQINWGEPEEMKLEASGTRSNFQGRYGIKNKAPSFSRLQ